MRTISSFSLLLLFSVMALHSASAASLTASYNPQPVIIPVPNGGNTSLVAAGCDLVQSNSSHRSFYVDPVHGNINNNGSASAPWDTLTNVVAKKLSLFQPGDYIYLLSGDHGNVTINKFNTGFVTVLPATGQNPTLKSLDVVGSHWIFEGLKIQGIKGDTRGSTHVYISSSATAPTNNIIITGNTISSADDSENWSKADWQAKALQGISIDGRNKTYCITASYNSIYNVRVGIGVFSDQSLVTHNVIDTFTDDAMDYGANHLMLTHNFITNVNDNNDASHIDAMQGFVPGGVGYPTLVDFTDITIDSNMIVRHSNPHLNYSTYMQGIDGFSGGKVTWHNMTVTNNLVITNTYHGITFGNIHNALIANNTVLADGESTTAMYDVVGTTTAMDTVAGNTTWISVIDEADRPQSDHVVVRNNLSQSLNIGSLSPTITVDHNMTSGTIALFLDGKIQYFNKAGAYGSSNTLNPNLYNDFAAFDIKNFIYDAHLKNTAAAIGIGNSVQAPMIDIEGNQRTLPISLGAFNASAITYTGKVTFVANARQIGQPKLDVLVNGVKAGSVVVSADIHIGQVATYTVSFTSSTKPKTIDLVLEGYGATKVAVDSVDVYNLTALVDNKTVHLLSTPTIAKAGVLSLIGQTGVQFFTNGSTLEFDVSKI